MRVPDLDSAVYKFRHCRNVVSTSSKGYGFFKVNESRLLFLTVPFVISSWVRYCALIVSVRNLSHRALLSKLHRILYRGGDQHPFDWKMIFSLERETRTWNVISKFLMSFNNRSDTSSLSTIIVLNFSSVVYLTSIVQETRYSVWKIHVAQPKRHVHAKTNEKIGKCIYFCTEVRLGENRSWICIARLH